MFSRKTKRRRKYLLIDSNQQKRRTSSKKIRNKTLNHFAKLLVIFRVIKNLRASFFLTTVMLLVIGFISFAIFSPYFTIKNITIIRDNPALDIELVKPITKGFYGKNLIFFKKEVLKKKLLKNFLEFREIDIKEVWPDEISISIKLSPPAFTLFDMASASFAVISADGIILAGKPNDELPVIKIKDWDKPLVPGEKFISKEWLSIIQQIDQQFTQNLKLPIKSIILLPAAQEVHFIQDNTNETVFWFDLRIDPEKQLQKLELGANKIGLYSKPIEHVDLRIPKTLFWK